MINFKNRIKQIKKFCSKDKNRPSLLKPYFDGEKIWATDGKILYRGDSNNPWNKPSKMGFVELQDHFNLILSDVPDDIKIPNFDCVFPKYDITEKVLNFKTFSFFLKDNGDLKDNEEQKTEFIQKILKIGCYNVFKLIEIADFFENHDVTVYIDNENKKPCLIYCDASMESIILMPIRTIQ